MSAMFRILEKKVAGEEGQMTKSMFIKI